MSDSEAKAFGWIVIAAFSCVAMLLVWSGSQPSIADQHEKEQKTKIETALSSLTSYCRRALPERFVNRQRSTGKGGRSHATLEQVANFDILGIKLYEPLYDIVSSIRGLKIFPDQPGLSFVSCASDTIKNDRLWREALPGELPPSETSTCVGTVSFVKDKMSLWVKFAEDLPQHPGCMVASEISLDQGGRENDASQKAWDQKLSEKYGDPAAYAHYWGALGTEGPELEDGSYYGQFVLRLTDQKFSREKESARSEAVANAKPVAKPNF